MADRLRDRKREQTHERILAAGLRLFAERGYGATSTAEIAAAAGVSERTFFRHFPTKIDVFVTEFRHVSENARAAMASAPADALPIEVVRAGLLGFAAEVDEMMRIEPDRTRAIWGPELSRTMLEIVLSLEAAIVRELSRRYDVSRELVELRIIANASVGVLRAAARAQLINRPRKPLARTLTEALDRVGPHFDAFDRVRRRTALSPGRPPRRLRVKTPAS
jgi:AcrR family transcriptional regulator